MKMDLLAKVEVLGKELPLNTLDILIDRFGGPDKVAEVCYLCRFKYSIVFFFFF